MILLRPTINLYYDKVINDIPVPNGVSDYKFGRKYSHLPFMSSAEVMHNDQIIRNTYFLNAMKVNEVNFNILTGKDRAPNTFYPLELSRRGGNVSLVDIIPPKTLSRIVKGKMKILLLYQQYVGDFNLILELKSRVDKLIRHGVPATQIYLLLGDTNKSYQEMFKNVKVFGIDWWQIAHQITCKSRYNIEDYRWVSMNVSDAPLSLEQIKREQFDIGKWNDPEYLFSAFTARPNLQNVALLSELDCKGLLDKGQYSKNVLTLKANYSSKLLIDNDAAEEYKQKKQQSIKNVSKGYQILDLPENNLETDNASYDSSILYNSAISLITDTFVPKLDKKYLSETNAMWISRTIWKHIAIGHPFIALGSLCVHRYLNNEGYFSTTELFDEEFDRISNLAVRVNYIVNEIDKLANLNKKELQEKLTGSKDFLIYNKKKFYEKRHTWKFYDLFKEMEYERKT